MKQLKIKIGGKLYCRIRETLHDRRILNEHRIKSQARNPHNESEFIAHPQHLVRNVAVMSHQKYWLDNSIVPRPTCTMERLTLYHGLLLTNADQNFRQQLSSE